MKLHIFNPEHDIALAHNDKYFTAPKAGRKLREDCGFIPALWADKEDYVLVNNKDISIKRLHECCLWKADNVSFIPDSHFVTLSDLSKLSKGVAVEPWGWDSALCFQLARHGLPMECLPSEESLSAIRTLSNRRFSKKILTELRQQANEGIKDMLVGEAEYVGSLEELKDALSDNSHVVIKEPWSSSGRGVRYVEGSIDEPMSNWIRNIIRQQGGIMVEPYYNKVCDFGMEFIADNDGVHYRGLSLFNAVNGFYVGNVLASEHDKWHALTKLVRADVLLALRESIEELLSQELRSRYTGPLGVDMMVVDESKLHPMVEINLRRTMGHVAIDLYDRTGECSIMQIVYKEGCYKFVLNPITTNTITCCQ